MLCENICSSMVAYISASRAVTSTSQSETAIALSQPISENEASSQRVGGESAIVSRFCNCTNYCPPLIEAEMRSCGSAHFPPEDSCIPLSSRRGPLCSVIVPSTAVDLSDRLACQWCSASYEVPLVRLGRRTVAQEEDAL